VNAARRLIPIIAGLALLASLAVAGIGKSARQRLVHALAAIARPDTKPAADRKPRPAAAGDVEQQAEAAAGWSASILNSVTTGTIVRYDRSGAATSQAGITFYNKYPDKCRVELDHGGGNIEIIGFDQTAAWSNAKSSLTAGDERDIRSWLRSRPERLFTKRTAGSAYREAGVRFDDYIPGMPWQAPQPLAPEVQLDQVEIIDTVNPVAAASVVWSDRPEPTTTSTATALSSGPSVGWSPRTRLRTPTTGKYPRSLLRSTTATTSR
jgi:hypothetical protein